MIELAVIALLSHFMCRWGVCGSRAAPVTVFPKGPRPKSAAEVELPFSNTWPFCWH